MAGWLLTCADDIDADGPGSAITGFSATGGRAIVFNGTTQYAQVNVPNSAPWNNLGAFQIIARVRGLTSASGEIMSFWNTAVEARRFGISAGGTGTRFDFHDERDALDIFHTPNTYTNVVFKLQYDPTNTRWTMESWKADGTGYVSGTAVLVTTTNWDFSTQNHRLSIPGTMYGTTLTDPHVDWFGWKEGVDAMGSGNFPGADIPAGTYLLKYTFDSDNGNDTSGNGLNLTLTGTPTFENTP